MTRSFDRPPRRLTLKSLLVTAEQSKNAFDLNKEEAAEVWELITAYHAFAVLVEKKIEWISGLEAHQITDLHQAPATFDKKISNSHDQSSETWQRALMNIYRLVAQSDDASKIILVQKDSAKVIQKSHVGPLIVELSKLADRL